MAILNGYKEIGAALGRSDRAARRLLRDGMPVTMVGGRATSSTEALAWWINRRMGLCAAPGGGGALAAVREATIRDPLADLRERT